MFDPIKFLSNMLIFFLFHQTNILTVSEIKSFGDNIPRDLALKSPVFITDCT